MGQSDGLQDFLQDPEDGLAKDCNISYINLFSSLKAKRQRDHWRLHAPYK
jgi:hypothetical protein